MKYFFDTEFIEDGKTIDLISIGIKAENGREYYAVSNEFDGSKASYWVQHNVLVHVSKTQTAWQSRESIRSQILEFIGTDKPEFWAYYADYDWVALCQLFGAMMNLPKGWPFYCRDIKQLCDSLGNPTLPKQESKEHHALADACWNKQCYEFLTKQPYMG